MSYHHLGADAEAHDEQNPERSVAANDNTPGGLLGSSKFGSTVMVYGKETSLGEAVRAAFGYSGLSVEEWNGLDEAERDRLVGNEIDIDPSKISQEDVIEFDPFAALQTQGVTLPEPVEVEFPVEAPVENTAEWQATVEEAREQYIEPVEEQTSPVASGNPKDAIGLTKPDLSLVPAAGLLYTSQAMMDGAAKYGPYNWRDNPVKMRVYIAAAQRHLAQLLDGEDFDPISGVHHIGHAAACLMILADARETGNLIDDRPATGPAGDMIRRFGDTGSYQK